MCRPENAPVHKPLAKTYRDAYDWIMTIHDFLSTAEAAALLGISPMRVRQYINANRLPATKVGSFYVIARSDLARLERLPVGRPRRQEGSSTTWAP